MLVHEYAQEGEENQPPRRQCSERLSAARPDRRRARRFALEGAVRALRCVAVRRHGVAKQVALLGVSRARSPAWVAERQRSEKKVPSLSADEVSAD
jgi:hypothetical protein